MTSNPYLSLCFTVGGTGCSANLVGSYSIGKENAIEAVIATGESVIKCPSLLNVRKAT